MRWLAVVLASLGLYAVAGVSSVDAKVVRFAVLVGHNQGEPDEAALRWAETDAERMRDVLVDLGDFAPENVVLIRGRPATDVRRAVLTVNERIRSLPAGDEALLVVYFSGHGDHESLHLGATPFELEELHKLIRGSAAHMRVLIVDACRSGALTRVKGGRKAAPFDIALDDRLAAQGVVFLTASAANEDAQESDVLQGSFFTHYLTSGLLGAADHDADGQVTLDEAYRHAYDRTLRASSRSAGGLQHPTFDYALAGRGDIVLTRLGNQRDRGVLAVPEGRSYLIMQGDAEGRVVAEIGVKDATRTVSVRPGLYFVRGRGRESLLEGRVRVESGRKLVVADHLLERFEYARLVRKGAVLRRSLAFDAGLFVHSPLPSSQDACVGSEVTVGADYRTLGLGVRAAWCRSGFENEVLMARNDELVVSAVGWTALDIGRTSLAPAIHVGPGVLRQRFETTGTAPAQSSLFVSIGVSLRIARDLGRGIYAYAEPALDVHVDASADLPAVVRVGFGIGWRP